MYISVGHVIKKNNKLYECREKGSDMTRSEACSLCAFRDNCPEDMDCTRYEREDEKDIYFSFLSPVQPKLLKKKKSVVDIFRQLHSFIFDGTSLRYERVTDSVKFTALTLTYMGLPCLIVTFKSGLVDSYKVFPSGEVYTSDYNFIKILGGKIFICNSLRIVDEVKFK